MKKIVFLILILFIIVPSISLSSDFDFELVGCRKSERWFVCEGVLTNNTSKELVIAEVAVIIAKDKIHIDSESRVFSNVYSNSFQSRTYYFKTSQDFNQYKWSITNIRLR